MPEHHDARLRVTIREGAGAPYEQLRDAIRTRIERGTFAPGDRLPPVRTAALELDLAPNTVARSYRELESEGWLVGRGRAGTFVPDRLPDGADPAAALEAAARDFLRRARALGYDLGAAIAAVRAARL
jgi:DNA-binding transcriptional regulator YhcF (GntR family)